MAFADVILAVHAGVVLFVVAGMAAIAIGGLRQWAWVRNCPFRIAHMATIIFVAWESLLGLDCPLTVWENELRGDARQAFISHWVHRLMFYELPAWVFTTTYLISALLVAAAWYWVPPRCSRQARAKSA